MLIQLHEGPAGDVVFVNPHHIVRVINQVPNQSRVYLSDKTDLVVQEKPGEVARLASQARSAR
jgi:hypothetical protein